MKPTRVVLVGVPTMLCEIIREVATTVPELDLIVVLPGPLAARVEATGVEPDVVIVGAEATSDDEVAGLLHRFRGLRVLGLSADAAHTTLYEMRPHRVELGELGTEALLGILCGGDRS